MSPVTVSIPSCGNLHVLLLPKMEIHFDNVDNETVLTVLFYPWLHFTILRAQGAVTRGGRGRGSNRGKRPNGAGRGGRRAPQKQRMCEDCEENAATQFCADCQPPLVLCDNCALVLHRGVTRRNHKLKGKVPLRYMCILSKAGACCGSLHVVDNDTANQKTKCHCMHFEVTWPFVWGCIENQNKIKIADAFFSKKSNLKYRFSSGFWTLIIYILNS